MEEHMLYQAEQDLFESVLCGIVRYSRSEDPKPLAFNSACVQMYGYQDKESFRQALDEGKDRLVYFYDREILNGFIRRCIRTGQIINFGHRIQRRDGSVSYIMGTLGPMTMPDGQPALQAIFIDSGQRVVQADLRKSIYYQPVHSQGQLARIVLACDSAAERQEMREILAREYHVIDAENGQEVLSVLGKEKGEVAAVLVSTDIVSQGDFRFMAALKSSTLYAAIPVVVLGGADEGVDADEESLLACGANEYLRRPFRPNVIRLRLSNLIELRDTAAQRNAIETLVDNLPGGVIIFRVGKTVELLYASNHLATFGGRTEEENEALIRGDLLTEVYDQDRRRVLAGITASAASGAPIETTFRVPQKDGSLFWVHAHAIQVRKENGAPIYQAIISPTSAREKMYQSMLDDAFCAIAVSDAATDELLYVNNEAAALMDMTKADCSRQTDCPWTAYRGQALSADAYTAMQSTDERTHRHLNMNGKLMDWNGIKARIVYAADDTESYRQQNERLAAALDEAKQANAAKSMFLSRMSHDIRTPMNAILGMSRLALDEGDGAVVGEYLGKIISSSEYLLALINDILDMSRIESDRVELEYQPYTLRECVDFVLVSMRTEMEQGGLRFTYTEPEPPERPLLMDRMRMQQILFNLISNAVKFTPPGGSIAVCAELLEKSAGAVRCRLTVRDTGTGIRADALERIFEPFEQVERRENAPNRSGSGLGLAIVKNLVQLMGGTVWAESTLGQGTCFVLELSFDMADESTVSTGGASKTALASWDFTGHRVLLAEDHPINLEIAVRLLEKEHCEVDCVENGQAALDALLAAAPGTYQAVLMDIRMPVMDGLSAAKAIRATGRADLETLPIIAMTANAFDEDVRKSRQAGMCAHLSKPIRPELLYQTLQEAWSKENDCE